MIRDTHISIHDLLQKVDNKFLLVIAVAKRARQIKEGAKPLDANCNPELAVISAMEELLGNKVGVEFDINKEVEVPEEEMNVIRRKSKPREEAVHHEPTEEEDKKNAAKLKKKEKLEKSKKRNKSLVA